ncbi:MAG: thiamine phosphate synthase [Proteobacteria bacterium]|nr:thiamine phosphate synthase [Pseudomonadota bacterium]
MKKPLLHDFRLYLVTDPLLNKGYSVLEQVELALIGGVKIIQIREKKMPILDYIKLASEALKLTRAHDAFLIINDAIEVAMAVGTDGLHLGQEDISIKEARNILGAGAVIGISVKTEDEAVYAEENGADYLAVNGIFPTATKEDLGDCVGLEGITRIREITRLPVIGIGGITLSNCRSVIEAGAHGIAVVTAITMSDNIPQTCRSFLDIMDE